MGGHALHLTLAALPCAVVLGVFLFGVLVVSLWLEWRTERISDEMWDLGYAYARNEHLTSVSPDVRVRS